MGELKVSYKCGICKRDDEDLSLLSANHKDLGWIMVCNDCWRKLYAENSMVSGSTGSGKNSASPCDSCSRCCH